MAVTQKAHVPKFGDWESEDIPYTACFDHARQSKPATAAKFNPNDPEDNPEAFMAIASMQRRAQESDFPASVRNDDSISGAVSGKVNAVALTGSRVSTTSAEKLQRGTRNANAGFASESGTEASSSDLSLLKKKRQNGSRGNNNISSSSSSTSRSDHGLRPRGRVSSTNNQSFDRGNQHQFDKPASIPKFGSWHVNDSKSGEAFTTIFDKVKEQKQISSSDAYKVINVPQPPMPLKNQSKSEKPSCLSKICCCMFSSGSD